MESRLFSIRKEGVHLLVVVLSLLAVAGLGVIDYVTGFEISFSVFYLLPILFVVWRSTTLAAVFVSLVSAVVWGAVDVLSGHGYSENWIPVWNALTRFGFFSVVVYFGSAFRTELEKEKVLARTDSLTGMANTRYFGEYAERELSRSRRFGRSFSLAYIDLDNFKKVNDTHGHSKGDALLCTVAGIMKKRTRSYDLIARLGGDEFAILLPESDGHQAALVVEKIREAIASCDYGGGLSVTFSAGVVTFMKPPVSIDSALKEADDLMYQAKKEGKNAVRAKVVIS